MFDPTELRSAAYVTLRWDPGLDDSGPMQAAGSDACSKANKEHKSRRRAAPRAFLLSVVIHKNFLKLFFVLYGRDSNDACCSTEQITTARAHEALL